MLQVIDLFAGGGGASLGIQRALGVSPALAINHNPAAIRMHAANHPTTVHLTEDLFKVQPHKPRRGTVDLVWGSPDCTHHSRAKGGRPLMHGRRLLAWVLVEWAREVHPRVLILENVPEFVSWGPLGDDDKPIKARKGETFREFVAALQLAGYRVEWRVLNAADFGAPTARRRLFLVARSDGQPIRWPEPTHGPGRARAWLPASGCIDWTVPMLSIFASRAEARVWARETDADGIPIRPLAEATQRRIAAGVRRFVLENPRPFVVQVDHGCDPARHHDLDRPFPTVATGTGAHGFGLVAPSLVRYQGERREGEGGCVHSLEDPLGTATTANRFGLLGASLVRTDMQSDGHLRGVAGLEEPLRTVTSSGGHALVGVAIAHTANGERKGQAPRVRGLDRPFGTVCATGSQGALVAAWLAKHHGSGPTWNAAIGSSLDAPLHTITGTDTKSLVELELGTEPVGNARQVAAFLTKFYGTAVVGQGLGAPVPTVTAGGNHVGLVTVEIDGASYVVTDIGMRMLTPRELARAQGLPEDYVLTGTKREQTAMVGNSVVPQVAEALVRAQFGLDPAELAA